MWGKWSGTSAASEVDGDVVDEFFNQSVISLTEAEEEFQANEPTGPSRRTESVCLGPT